MLKKVIFAAALAIGFMASYRVGAASEATGIGATNLSCPPYICGTKCGPDDEGC